MTPYVPKPQRGSSVSNGFFRKDEFCYDAARDAFICPAGQVLSTRTESKLRELTKIDYRNRAACLVCAIKSRCTKDYRKVSRLENEAVLDRMAARRKARPAILDRAARDGRASLRLDQAMDEPGRLSDEGPRQCPRPRSV